MGRFAAAGVTELWLKPNYASYEPGERAVLTLQGQWFGRRGGEALPWRFRIRLRQAECSVVENDAPMPGDYRDYRTV